MPERLGVRDPRELAGRVVAAVLLAGVFALAFWGGRIAWGAVTLALLVVAAFEWARLVRVAPVPYTAVVAALALLGVWLLDTGPDGGRNLYRAALLHWLVLAPLALLGMGLRAPLARALAGALVLVGVWVAVMALHRHSPVLLVSAIVLVALYDSVAYLVGRRFGRKRMSPKISPKKTWEGLAGSFFCACAASVAAWAFLKGEPALSLLLMASCAVLALSVVGDLYVSTLKRGAQVSDSGRLFLGHGGALDLADGLLPVLPFVALAGERLTAAAL